MLTIVVSILFFVAAIALLSLGVIMKKKTPLKGSCGNAARAREAGSKEHVCEVCSCDKV
jgi:hypothetical protein